MSSRILMVGWGTLESGGIHSQDWWSMMSVGRDISWDNGPKHRHMVSPWGLGFHKEWWPQASRTSYITALGSTSKCPNLQGRSVIVFMTYPQNSNCIISSTLYRLEANHKPIRIENRWIWHRLLMRWGQILTELGWELYLKIQSTAHILTHVNPPLSSEVGVIVPLLK